MEAIAYADFLSKQVYLLLGVFCFGIGSTVFLYCESRWKEMNALNGAFIILGLSSGMAIVALGLYLIVLAIRTIT